MATMKTLNGYGFNATELNGKTSDNYLEKTDTATNSAKLGGKAPEYYLQPRNLLDNGDFRNPVNQRGIASGNVITNAYCIDRWKLLNVGQLTFDDGYIAISANQGYGVYFRQFFEKLPKFPVTVRLETTSGIITANLAINTRYTFNDDMYVEIDGSGFLDLFIPQGKSLSIVNIALYEGSYTADTLPPYVPKGYAAELAECQRYFYKMKSHWKWVSAGICESSTKAYIPIVLPREMRIVPTASITNPSLIKVKCGSVGPQIPSNIIWTYGILGARIMQMAATVTGATNGDVAFLYFDDGGEITFSADL